MSHAGCEVHRLVRNCEIFDEKEKEREKGSGGDIMSRLASSIRSKPFHLYICNRV